MLSRWCLTIALCCGLATAGTLDKLAKRRQANLDLDRRQSGATHPVGIQYIGVGYNYLRANPEGGMHHNGGIDPGVLTTRKHLKFTYSNCTQDGPKEVDISKRFSCVNETTTQMFYGTKSYQNKFSIDVQAEVDGDLGLVEYAFSASAMFAEARDQTITTNSIVRDEQMVCNRGRIRVNTELEKVRQISVDDGFAAVVCELPTTYDKAKYMEFLDGWGTHTIFQIELGKKVVKRSKASLKELVEFGLTEEGGSISASLGSGSFSLDFEALQQSDSFSNNFQSTLYTFTLGSDTEPSPIGLTIEPIPVILQPMYWQKLADLVSRRVCPVGTTLSAINTISKNVEQALKDYPEYLSLNTPTDLPFELPQVWPEGTYSFPQPTNGCPEGWLSGSRFHDTADGKPNNTFHLESYLKGTFKKNDLRWYFCTKTVEPSAAYAMKWPAGEYCIMKKGNCPTGFTEGEMRWDDEDENNNNSHDGVRPDGIYTKNTIIYFCCREDGFAENPIYLPTDVAFVLLRKTRLCQKVHHMNHRTLSIHWDDEDGDNNNYKKGSYPYNDGGKGNHKLYFCYYF